VQFKTGPGMMINVEREKTGLIIGAVIGLVVSVASSIIVWLLAG